MSEEMNETFPKVVYIQALSIAILYNTHTHTTQDYMLWQCS